MTGLSASRVLLALVLAVTTTLSLTVSIAAAAERSRGTVVAVVNVRDHLDRGLAGSLGRAQLGGRYAVAGHVRAHVAGGRAAVGPVGSGRSVRVLLPAIHTTDQRLRATVRLPKHLGHSGEWVGVKIRVQRAGSYRAVAHVNPAGRIGLRIDRMGNHGDLLATRRFVGRVQPGHAFYVDAMVTGQSPVRIRARVYAIGAHVPGWQLSVADGSRNRLRGAGAVAFVAATPRASAPTEVSLLDLLGWKYVHKTKPKS